MQTRPPLAWYLSARIGCMSLILLGVVFYQFWGRTTSVVEPVIRALYLLIALSYGQALLSALLLRSGRLQSWLPGFQVAWDLLVAAVLVGITGGRESLFSFVFLLVIVSSSLSLGRRSTLLTALVATLFYGLVIHLHRQGLMLEVTTAVSPRDFWVSLFNHATAFTLTALLASTLAERWRTSQLALERKVVDFDELERLNRAIVGNIGSGLAIVNPAGRIRAFNRAASRITGYELEEVYDRPFVDVFPNFRLHDAHQLPIVRGESHLIAKEGEGRFIGYATAAVDDEEGASVGMLVTFQDLTEVKRLEEQLSRADRLASVGRLASGMAHEIRNPLAAISGSVQMLLDREQLTATGRRLMDIVEREADRLGSLLGDFLNYARPPKPQIERFDVAVLLDELTDLARADHRCRELRIERSYERPFWLTVDRNQFRQAVWNLLSNARDVLNGNGTIRIASEEPDTVVVEDSGPGIPEDIRARIFDPFFTTKDKGTGLGLATLHAIVEAHGGTVDVGRGPLGGGCFKLYFPTHASSEGEVSATVDGIVR